MATLTKAHHEWATRAPDERFNSVEAMHAQALLYQQQARDVGLSSLSKLRVGVENNNVVLLGKTRPIGLTNWSFSQLCREASAPPSYLTTLPAPLAKTCLEHGLARISDDPKSLMFRENGGINLRAITSLKYRRLWNADLTKRLCDLKAKGTWQEAPEAFDGSRGQYLSDRDMFSFFVDNNRRIFETGPGGGLSRGFFLWNSEVGAASFGIMTFLYEYVCGNHRVWGANNINEIRVRHIGDSNGRGFQELIGVVRKYAESSAEEDELKIEAAREFKLGETKDEVLAKLFGLNLVPKKTVEAAYKRAEEHEEWYGDPRTAWAVSGGITEIARDLPNADERTTLDRVGSKVLALAWRK